jgi:hypothetical protein
MTLYPCSRSSATQGCSTEEGRSRAVSFSRMPGAQQTRNGIRILPDQVAASWPAEQLLPAIEDRKPAGALDEALHGIAARYGTRTADVVAMQLEHPNRAAPQFAADGAVHSGARPQ